MAALERSLVRTVALAVAACLASHASHAGKKEEPRVCAASTAELKVVSLEEHVKKKKGKFVLGKKSECLVTSDGINLPAVLVELPPFVEPYVVNIQSLLGGTVLAPRVDALDAAKAHRRSLGLADVKSRGDSLSIDVFMNQENAEERYLVLYPDPEALGRGESRSSMGMQTTYIATGYWMSGTESKQLVNYVDAGTLIVTLKGSQWDKKKK
ncbi:hypothetical protein JM946_21790 [Steroidobacter sp. S1-65]|uniref:Uncharacterized protein n=1 Tax=Steroidobacter gossypii TaxID=2805490 RepID=A0ABS1X2C5_9GAMM|nr:hypothetical protein [Steroidobacter gossypii]MBM0107380.1 hypothetical protein [Steroidobacter gossypii]